MWFVIMLRHYWCLLLHAVNSLVFFLATMLLT